MTHKTIKFRSNLAELVMAGKKIKRSLSMIDLKERSRKRVATILAKDPLTFKKMGKASAKKQRENYKNGYTNPNQNHSDLHIYNSIGEKIYTCKRIGFSDLCKIHDLPERVLLNSLFRNGEPIYQKQGPRKKKYVAYKSWYAAYETGH